VPPRRASIVCGMRPAARTAGVLLLVGGVGFLAESNLPPAGSADAPLAGYFGDKPWPGRRDAPSKQSGCRCEKHGRPRHFISVLVRMYRGR